MELWQLEIVGSVMMDDGTEAKVITGVDDHSRLNVIAKVVRRATGRAVCLAFVTAMQRYGMPDEVLTDNGKQFTGRFTTPHPRTTTRRPSWPACTPRSAARAWSASNSPDLGHVARRDREG
jgi:Integrase core domain